MNTQRTGLFRDIKADLAGVLRPSQFKALCAEIPSHMDAGALRVYPITVNVRVYDNKTARISFGFAGKPALESILLGERGGVRS